jgi:arginine utilization protein RocB
MQLQTGHSWLASHAKLHRFRENDNCECGARETVIHVLIDCLKLSALQQKLYEEVGEAFNNIMLMLKDRDKQRLKKLNSSAQRRAVNAVLDFAEASLRFQSRVARDPQRQDQSQETS